MYCSIELCIRTLKCVQVERQTMWSILQFRDTCAWHTIVCTLGERLRREAQWEDVVNSKCTRRCNFWVTLQVRGTHTHGTPSYVRFWVNGETRGTLGRCGWFKVHQEELKCLGSRLSQGLAKSWRVTEEFVTTRYWNDPDVARTKVLKDDNVVHGPRSP